MDSNSLAIVAASVLNNGNGGMELRRLLTTCATAQIMQIDWRKNFYKLYVRVRDHIRPPCANTNGGDEWPFQFNIEELPFNENHGDLYSYCLKQIHEWYLNGLVEKLKITVKPYKRPGQVVAQNYNYIFFETPSEGIRLPNYELLFFARIVEIDDNGKKSSNNFQFKFKKISELTRFFDNVTNQLVNTHFRITQIDKNESTFAATQYLRKRVANLASLCLSQSTYDSLQNVVKSYEQALKYGFKTAPYLVFFGEPGTGKTMAAKWLSAHLDKNAFVAPDHFVDRKSFETFMRRGGARIIDDVSPRGFWFSLLSNDTEALKNYWQGIERRVEDEVEEIEQEEVEQEEQEEQEASVSGTKRKKAPKLINTAKRFKTVIQEPIDYLLSCIDGPLSMDETITIFTTNMKPVDFRARLCPAMLRPGRIDTFIEFSNMTKYECESYMTRVFTETPRDKIIHVIDTILCGENEINPSIFVGRLNKFFNQL